jgi:hypothetical protein
MEFAIRHQNSGDSASPTNDPSIFELSLDAASDIGGFTVAIQSLSSMVREVRVDLYNSFTARWGEDGVAELFDSLGRIPELRQLEFYGLRIFPYQVPIAMIRRTLARATKLHEICLVGIQVSGEPRDFETFADTLKDHPSLKSFCLDNCRLENEARGPSLDDGIIPVLVQLPTLEKVVIRAMERSVWGTVNCKSVELLCASPTLKKLELFAFSPCCSNFMKVMAQSLQKHSNKSQLVQLSVAGSLGGLEGVKAISQMLHTNKTLRAVELHMRGRSDEDEVGIIELSKSLTHNKTLTKFQLHGTTDRHGSWDARNAFLEMLQSNYTLSDSVQVFHPGFLRPQNDFYLKLNRLGRGRLLGSANIHKEEWINTLFKARDDLSCLYYLLSMNPSLCSNSVTSVEVTPTVHQGEMSTLSSSTSSAAMKFLRGGADHGLKRKRSNWDETVAKLSRPRRMTKPSEPGASS